jgi:hypothetical protein
MQVLQEGDSQDQLMPMMGLLPLLLMHLYLPLVLVVVVQTQQVMLLQDM